MNDDSLLYLLRAPALVERALRKALAQMFVIRREYRRDCDARSFVKLALLASRTLRDRTLEEADELTRHETEAAVVRAAAFFAASPLGTRLRTIPLDRIVAAPRGIDLAVVDRRKHTHHVCLETFAGTEARLEAVTRAVRAMDRVDDAARASLHFFSLRDGTLRSYPARTSRRASGRVRSIAAKAA